MTTELEYPSELDDDVTLPNEKIVHISVLRRCEKAPVREMFAQLSPRTRYLRFFSPLPSLPDSVLRLLTCLDYRRGIALVAESVTGSGREIIGLGSFNAIDDHSAEVALVVRTTGSGSAALTLARHVLSRRGSRLPSLCRLVHADNFDPQAGEEDRRRRLGDDERRRVRTGVRPAARLGAVPRNYANRGRTPVQCLQLIQTTS
jgi:hypothetical protein